MFKRFFIFFAVSLLVSITISSLLSFLGIGHYIGQSGINYFTLMIFCLAWGLGGSFISLLISKPLAKWTMGVAIIENNSDPLVQKVHALAKKAGIEKMPEVGIYQSDEVNAFATGRSKNNSLVAVSSGLLREMDNDEVEGVLAHEVAHIANGDMVTMTLVTGVVNAFVMFFSRVIAFAITQAMRKDDDDAPVNPFVNFAIVFILDILFGLLALPIIAWFSRYREYRADIGGANLAGKNKMISALKSLQRTYPQLATVQNNNYSSMQISSKTSFLELISTHPILEKRIAALEKMNT